MKLYLLLLLMLASREGSCIFYRRSGQIEFVGRYQHWQDEPTGELSDFVTLSASKDLTGHYELQDLNGTTCNLVQKEHPHEHILMVTEGGSCRFCDKAEFIFHHHGFFNPNKQYFKKVPPSTLKATENGEKVDPVKQNEEKTEPGGEKVDPAKQNEEKTEPAEPKPETTAAEPKPETTAAEPKPETTADTPVTTDTPQDEAKKVEAEQENMSPELPKGGCKPEEEKPADENKEAPAKEPENTTPMTVPEEPATTGPENEKPKEPEVPATTGPENEKTKEPEASAKTEPENKETKEPEDTATTVNNEPKEPEENAGKAGRPGEPGPNPKDNAGKAEKPSNEKGEKENPIENTGDEKLKGDENEVPAEGNTEKPEQGGDAAVNPDVKKDEKKLLDHRVHIKGTEHNVKIAVPLGENRGDVKIEVTRAGSGDKENPKENAADENVKADDEKKISESAAAGSGNGVGKARMFPISRLSKGRTKMRLNHHVL